MTSLYLRLAGPLQSWAGPRVTGNVVRTEPVPTLTGLQGFVSAACGVPRGTVPAWLESLRFSVRVDNPGVLTDDFQTINPRLEDQEYQQRLLRSLQQRVPQVVVFTPDGQNTTSIVRRTLVAGAEFIVQISSAAELTRIAQAFRSPAFSPYLGRRTFAPGFPLLLGLGDDAELSRLPVARAQGWDDSNERALIVHHLVASGATRCEQVRVPVVNRAAWLDDVAGRLRRQIDRVEGRVP